MTEQLRTDPRNGPETRADTERPEAGTYTAGTTAATSGPETAWARSVAAVALLALVVVGLALSIGAGLRGTDDADSADTDSADTAADVQQADSCALSGTVLLAGRRDHSGTQVMVDDDAVAQTDSDGAFSADVISAGPFVLAAANPGYLSAEGVTTCKGDPVEAGSVELSGGDADRDDDVDLFDLVLLGANYGNCSEADGFDNRADINASDCVDLFDLVLLGSNYGTAGPVVWPADDGGGGGAVSFAGDVQPILQSSCVLCHGAAGGVDLTSYAAVMAGGDEGPVVVPGDAAASLLVKVLTGDAMPPMPPGNPLSEDQIETIRQWIDAGAQDN